jgi:RHS repeat-associated protein
VAGATGTTVWRWDQAEPFGNNPADENPSGLGAFDLPLRLPGQRYDKETNLHYNYFRDYDPTIGRYTESDPIGLDGGLNTYAYVGGRSLMLTDPLGLDWGVCCADDRKQKTSDDEDRIGASHDFARNYHDMRNADWTGGDKYFHCKANCEAAQRGPAGHRQSIVLSGARELTDQVRFTARGQYGGGAADAAADEIANSHGRESGKQAPCASCRVICQPFRPSYLPLRF